MINGIGDGVHDAADGEKDGDCGKAGDIAMRQEEVSIFCCE